MRYARILSIGLVATVAFAWSAAAVENAHELAGYCQSLERGAKGAGPHIYIPRTREALICWGYMRAIEGFIKHAPNKLDPSRDLRECQEHSLVFLYRLLFILYAEDRGLLPYRVNQTYTNKLLRWINLSSPPLCGRSKRGFHA